MPANLSVIWKLCLVHAASEALSRNALSLSQCHCVLAVLKITDQPQAAHVDTAKQVPTDGLLEDIVSRIPSPVVTTQTNISLSQDMKRLVKEYSEIESFPALLHLLLSNPDIVLAESIHQILNPG